MVLGLLLARTLYLRRWRPALLARSGEPRGIEAATVNGRSAGEEDDEALEVTVVEHPVEYLDEDELEEPAEADVVEWPPEEDIAGNLELGILLERQGDVRGAAEAYDRADRAGDADAAFHLGVLLEKQGDADGAGEAYDRADRRGHAAAAFNLAGLLAQHGDLAGAQDAYRRARERDRGEIAEMAQVALLELGERI